MRYKELCKKTCISRFCTRRRAMAVDEVRSVLLPKPKKKKHRECIPLSARFYDEDFPLIQEFRIAIDYMGHKHFKDWLRVMISSTVADYHKLKSIKDGKGGAA